MSTRGRASFRRKSSIGTSLAQDDFTMDQSRRYTRLDEYDDDECLTTTRGGRRKYSWGPVGEHGFRDSIRSAISTSSRSPVSHHECKLFKFQSIDVVFPLIFQIFFSHFITEKKYFLRWDFD
jgi:hypothetical protein